MGSRSVHIQELTRELTAEEMSEKTAEEVRSMMRLHGRGKWLESENTGDLEKPDTHK